MGVRELANPLGNPLVRPRAAAGSVRVRDRVITDFYSPGLAQFKIPVGYWACRLIVVGPGGNGGGGSSPGPGGGGGGGGCAATRVIALNGRSYSLSMIVGSAATPSSLSGLGYNLIATRGANGEDSGSFAGGLGGLGSGGDFNFQGGKGGNRSYPGGPGAGGGAAGPDGKGGDGAPSTANSMVGGNGTGSAGGGGATGPSSFYGFGGCGGGPGGHGQDFLGYNAEVGKLGGVPISVIEFPSSYFYGHPNWTSFVAPPGAGGGGFGTGVIDGGTGLIRIEYW